MSSPTACARRSDACRSGNGSSSSCGHPVHGLGQDGEGEHWIGWTISVPGPFGLGVNYNGPKYLFGPAAPNVHRIDLESEDAATVSVRTFAGPDRLPIRARYWVVVLPLGHLIHTVVPRDADGDALERWELEQAW